MKITNIANNRDKQGYFYSSEHYHPTTHHLAVEPWLCGYCLKLDSEIEIPSHSYFAEKDYMDSLKANRIIDFEVPSKPQKEVAVEQKATQEKVTEKTFIFSEKLTEIAQSTVDIVVSSMAAETDCVKELVEPEADKSSYTELLEKVKEAEKLEEKEPAKKPIKPYSFQKGKK